MGFWPPDLDVRQPNMLAWPVAIHEKARRDSDIDAANEERAIVTLRS